MKPDWSFSEAIWAAACGGFCLVFGIIWLVLQGQCSAIAAAFNLCSTASTTIFGVLFWMAFVAGCISAVAYLKEARETREKTAGKP